MGGLVARGAALKSDAAGNPLPLRRLLTLSTPWGGHDAAVLGVTMAPATVPSWIDMVPDSDYQRALFARQLPRSVQHFLIFSYRGGRGGEANDGVVTVASQLRPEAQAQATRVLGFNEDHNSIVSSPAIFDAYRALQEAR